MKLSHGQWFWLQVLLPTHFPPGTFPNRRYALDTAPHVTTTWHPKRTLPKQPWEAYERETADAFGGSPLLYPYLRGIFEEFVPDDPRNTLPLRSSVMFP